MSDEIIDIYDSEMNLLGVSTKDQAHKEGLWHKVFHSWIVSEDGNIWLQFRSLNKQIFPALLDVSCKGHVLVGEMVKSSGLHKLEENFGLHLKEYDLAKMFTHKMVFDNPIINREFCSTYLYKTQTKIYDLRLQPENIYGMYEVDIGDLIDLFFDEVKKITIKGLVYKNGQYIKEERSIDKSDFCPYGDKYYQKVFCNDSKIYR